MASKTWVKFSHIIVFFLLATSLETLMARKESNGQEVIELFKELTSVDDSKLQCPPGKQRWPELVGVPSVTAKILIQRDNRLIKIVPILLAGSPITRDLRCDRVRIFENILGVVVKEPVVT